MNNSDSLREYADRNKHGNNKQREDQNPRAFTKLPHENFAMYVNLNLAASNLGFLSISIRSNFQLVVPSKNKNTKMTSGCWL